jgi:predicted secreted hydrolase
MLTVLPHHTFSIKHFGSATTTPTGTTLGAVTDGLSTGSLSNASPNDIARLEEGKRTREAYKYFTSDTLQTAQNIGLLPECIQIGDNWFEIAMQTYWDNGVMSHNEYVVVKIENPQDRMYQYVAPFMVTSGNISINQNVFSIGAN